MMVSNRNLLFQGFCSGAMLVSGRVPPLKEISHSNHSSFIKKIAAMALPGNTSVGWTDAHGKNSSGVSSEKSESQFHRVIWGLIRMILAGFWWGFLRCQVFLFTNKYHGFFKPRFWTLLNCTKGGWCPYLGLKAISIPSKQFWHKVEKELPMHFGEMQILSVNLPTTKRLWLSKRFCGDPLRTVSWFLLYEAFFCIILRNVSSLKLESDRLPYFIKLCHSNNSKTVSKSTAQRHPHHHSCRSCDGYDGHHHSCHSYDGYQRHHHSCRSCDECDGNKWDQHAGWHQWPRSWSNAQSGCLPEQPIESLNMEVILWGHDICCGQRKEPWSAGTKHPHTHLFPILVLILILPITILWFLGTYWKSLPTVLHHISLQHRHMFHPARTWATTTLIGTTPALLVRRPTTFPRKLVAFRLSTLWDASIPKRVLIRMHVFICLFTLYMHITPQTNPKRTDLEKKPLRIENYYIIYHLKWWSIYIPWEGEDV